MVIAFGSDIEFVPPVHDDVFEESDTESIVEEERHTCQDMYDRNWLMQ